MPKNILRAKKERFPKDMNEESARAYSYRCIASIAKTFFICLTVYACVRVISNNKHKN